MAGGTSGQIGFPDYIESAHEKIVYNGGDFVTREVEPDLLDLVSTYVQSANSPYSEESAYNPSTRVTNMLNGVTALGTKVNGLARATDWNTNMTQALSKASSHFGVTQVKNDIVTLTEHADDKIDVQIGSVFTRVKSQVTDLFAQGYSEVLDVVQGVLDGLTTDTTVIDDEVDNYEEKLLPSHMRSVNRLASAFFMGGAVHSSSFGIAMGQLERDFTRQVGEYRISLNRDYFDKHLALFATLLSAYLSQGIAMTQGQIAGHIDNYKNWLISYVQDKGSKTQFINAAASEMTQLLMAETQGKKDYAALAIEGNRIGAVLEKEQWDSDMELDVLDTTWPFDIMIKATTVLGGLGGTPTVPQKPTKLQSAVSGGLSGASFGAQVTGGNPWGIGVGAVVGSVAGYLS